MFAPERRPIHVLQGDCAVAAENGVVLSAILGSCVATCMWDARAGVGGMNHFLLPGDLNSGDATMFGVNAMELLVNGLMQQGAVRKRLQAKLFGGAHVVQGSQNIGERNGAFAEEFLRCESIPCVARSLGGASARSILFWPTSGRAKQKLLAPTHADPVLLRDAPASPPPGAGSVEIWW